MARLSVLVLALGCGVSNAAQPLSPAVTQTSKKFLKDFTNDVHAKAEPGTYYFAHPYPAVQDTDAFDKDFTKDENTDGGKWQSQMDYDLMRQKVRVAEQELARLLKRDTVLSDAVKSAKKVWSDSVAKAEAAKVVTEASKGEVVEADAAIKEVKDDIAAQTAKVDKEVKQLDVNRKALADAKQHLKDLKEQKVAQEKADKEAKVAAVKAKKDELVNALKAKKDVLVKKEQKVQTKISDLKAFKASSERDQLEDSVSAEVRKEQSKNKKLIAAAEAKAEKEEKEYQDHKKDIAKRNAQIARKNLEIKIKNAGVVKDVNELKKDMAKDDAVWKKRIAEDKKAYEAEAIKYEKAMTELKEYQDKLDKAAARLKVYRRNPHVDQDGGVYVTTHGGSPDVPEVVEKEEKSGAMAWHLNALVAFILAAAMAM